MKAVKTPKCDVTFTLAGGTEQNDLPAQRAMLYNPDLGQTPDDAQLGHVSTWTPDEHEARRLEAGACVELTVWGHGHPAVSLTVTDAVVPERALLDRGHVDRAMGVLYAKLKDTVADRIDDFAAIEVEAGCPAADDVLPHAGDFVDLWIAAVEETGATVTADQNGRPGPTDATPED